MSHPLDLSGRGALVTGASSGIGAATAIQLAALGAHVAIGYHDNEAGAQQAKNAIVAAGGRAVVLRADVRKVDEIHGLVDQAADALGGIDILVNNAGSPKRKHITATDYATVENVMRINYLGPAKLTLALLPSLLENKGRVVNVSSIAATLSSPGEAAYDASKAALAVFSEAVAVDLWETGVKVMVVYPGVVDTPLFSLPDNDPLPDSAPPKITVDEMVDAILEGIDNDAVEVYAPQWFKDIAVGKAQNTKGFIEGAANWLRETQG